MVQSSNNTVNAIINNFNKASKKAQKNGNYIKTVKVTDDIRLVYDLGWFDNHYLGNIRIQQKQDNGRYETIGKWVWHNGDFENFVPSFLLRKKKYLIMQRPLFATSLAARKSQ